MALHIQERIPLTPLTTLKCGGNAEYFTHVDSIEALEGALTFAEEKKLKVTILGGGSNVLVSDAGVRGLVIRPLFTNIVYHTHGTEVYVESGAGVTLDALIEEVVGKNLWGLENLSGIPGSVGAVPIQNVGAYGVEAKDLVHEVLVYNRDTKHVEKLSAAECAFAYRHSLFKTEAGKRYIVVGVIFRLGTLPHPRISYRDLQEYFKEDKAPTLESIRRAVITIREGKFPDWRTVGTAGSFFKNPILSQEAYEALQVKFPLVPGFAEAGRVKVPLGWILDHVLNLKGYREGNVGLYEKQALVLIQYGTASSDEVLDFAERIREQVLDAAGVRVEFEAVYVA
jgi:UDP-N-acetylmuramate dehydrogenase